MSTHFGNYYLTLSEMHDNVDYIAGFLLSQGWTVESISAMLGNMQSESTINGGIWENLDYGNLSGGYGLVQWTPATKYINWMTQSGLPDNLDSQLIRLDYEIQNNLQWIPSLAGGMTFQQFKESTASPYDLAILFIRAYERPANPNQPIRGVQANYWYEYITGNPPIPPQSGKWIELILSDALPLFR